MSIVQTTYPSATDPNPQPVEPKSIVLIIDGPADEDLQPLHLEIVKVVEQLKQEHHDVSSGIVPTKYLCSVKDAYLRRPSGSRE